MTDTKTDQTQASEATQVAHPWRATARTAAATIIALIPVLAVALPILAEELGPHLPVSVTAALGGTAVVLTALISAVTRIMALPQMQPLLEAVGLGAGRTPGKRELTD